MSSRLPPASRIARGLARASVAREVGVGHGTVERIARQMDRLFEATAAGLGGFCKLVLSIQKTLRGTRAENPLESMLPASEFLYPGII